MHELRKKIIKSSKHHFCLNFMKGELHVIHGEKDRIVPVSQFNNLKDKLIGDKNYFYLKDGSHDLYEWPLVKSLLLR